jgi:hypothetical protein
MDDRLFAFPILPVSAGGVSGRALIVAERKRPTPRPFSLPGSGVEAGIEAEIVAFDQHMAGFFPRRDANTDVFVMVSFGNG